MQLNDGDYIEVVRAEFYLYPQLQSYNSPLEKKLVLDSLWAACYKMNT